LAALLRDVGVLVLLYELGEPYARFLGTAVAADKDVAELEAGVLGFDHRALAARLLQRWRLPGSLVSAINLSLRPNVDSLVPAEQALPRILRLAQLMADLLVDHRHLALDRLKREPAIDGPLSIEQIQELVDSLESKVQQLAEVFAFELPPGVDYRDVLVEAHKQMSRVASEMTGDWLNFSASSQRMPEESTLLAEVESLAAAAAQFSAREAVGLGRPDSTSFARTDAESPGSAGGAICTRADAAEPDRLATPFLLAPRPAKEYLATIAPTVIDGTLTERLASALAACRQKRAPLSLVLVEIDRFDALAQSVGPIAAEQLVCKVGGLCQACEVPAADSRPVSQACFALILPNCDRGEAVEHGDRLLIGFRDYVQRESNPNIAGLTVSVGVATVPSPPRNFRVDDLIASANRCLAAALRSGNSLKSIGIY
jgi:GGDEF domain-containing protein